MEEGDPGGTEDGSLGKSSAEGLNVNQLIGSSLFKQDRHASALRKQAKALTGMPLINFNLKGAKKDHHGDGLKRTYTTECLPPQLVAIQQQHLSYMLARSHKFDPSGKGKLVFQPDAEQDPESFVPRLIRPRRRRKATKTLSSTSEPDENGHEIHIEDEMHLLPTDLLSDVTHTSDIAPIKPPTKPLVRHTESFHLLDSFNKSPVGVEKSHLTLRKTFSWANSSSTNTGSSKEDESYWPDPDLPTFSLFPKTSQSDLLSSVRSDLLSSELAHSPTSGIDSDFSLGSSTSKKLAETTSDLEKALKSLNIKDRKSVV